MSRHSLLYSDGRRLKAGVRLKEFREEYGVGRGVCLGRV